MTTVYLLSGSSWPLPGDWSSTNTIESIAAGGGASNVSASDSAGGGGGAYSEISNLAGLISPITMNIGTGGSANNAGGDTWFNGASLAASSVGAKGGHGGSTITGGLGGEQVGNTGGVGTTKK